MSRSDVISSCPTGRAECLAGATLLICLLACLRPEPVAIVHVVEGVQHPAQPEPRSPQRQPQPQQPELLLVLGVMCTERRHDRRAWLRAHYERSAVSGVLVRFFVDASWLASREQNRSAHARGRHGAGSTSDVVGVAHAFEAWPTCGGWGSSDAPGSCATQEARVMAKAQGWWWVAKRWATARFIGKTDDDCVVALPELASLLRAVPRGRPVYAGKMYYTSMDGRAADQLRAMPCYSNHGPDAALGTRYFEPSCAGLRGPIPFASGPLVLLSAPLRAWLERRHGAAPAHSREANAQVEDALLGWQLSHHPALDLVDLAFAMRQTNVRKDFRDATWRGFDGLVAHKVDTRADMRRVAAALAARNRSGGGGGGGDGGGLRCAPWRERLAALDAFPCCRDWNLCVPPEQAAAARRAAAAAAAEKLALRGGGGDDGGGGGGGGGGRDPAGNESASRGGGGTPGPPRWLATARHGYCGVTSAIGDCEKGVQGSFEGIGLGAAGAAMDWELLLGRCLQRCSRCARCRYISASLAWRDCSWFASCDGDNGNLSSSIPGFLTLRTGGTGHGGREGAGGAR